MITPQDEINSWAELTPEQKRAEILALQQQQAELAREIEIARQKVEAQELLKLKNDR